MMTPDMHWRDRLGFGLVRGLVAVTVVGVMVYAMLTAEPPRLLDGRVQTTDVEWTIMSATDDQFNEGAALVGAVVFGGKDLTDTAITGAGAGMLFADGCTLTVLRDGDMQTWKNQPQALCTLPQGTIIVERSEITHYHDRETGVYVRSGRARTKKFPRLPAAGVK